MYELLLRIETLLLGLQTPVLWALGIGAIVVGLVLWLGGTRYHAAIIGVLGAVVGSAAGLLVSQQFDLRPWLGMAVGAAVLGGLSILLRNVLILVLAVLVFATVGGAGYVSVVLDRAAPQIQPSSPAQPQLQAGQQWVFQHFSGMDLEARQKYMNDISQRAQTFSERLKALLANTWQALGPHDWVIVVPILAGAVVGILLIWLIAKIVTALAYSLVGTATLLFGVHAAALAAGVPVVSDLQSRPWVPLVVLVALTAVGWVWQLFFAGAKKPKSVPPQKTEPAD